MNLTMKEPESNDSMSHYSSEFIETLICRWFAAVKKNSNENEVSNECKKM
jgi:hypothetical protein